MLTLKSSLREYLARKVFKVKVRFYMLRDLNYGSSLYSIVGIFCFSLLCTGLYMSHGEGHAGAISLDKLFCSLLFNLGSVEFQVVYSFECVRC